MGQRVLRDDPGLLVIVCREGSGVLGGIIPIHVLGSSVSSVDEARSYPILRKRSLRLSGEEEHCSTSCRNPICLVERSIVAISFDGENPSCWKRLDILRESDPFRTHQMTCWSGMLVYDVSTNRVLSRSQSYPRAARYPLFAGFGHLPKDPEFRCWQMEMNHRSGLLFQRLSAFQRSGLECWRWSPDDRSFASVPLNYYLSRGIPTDASKLMAVSFAVDEILPERLFVGYTDPEHTGFGNDRTLYPVVIWDLNKMTEMRRFMSRMVGTLVLSPFDSTILTKSPGGFQFWDSRSFEKVGQLELQFPGSRIAFWSKFDEHRIVVQSDKEVFICDQRKPSQPVCSWNRTRPYGVIVEVDEDRVASSTGEIWNFRGRLLKKFDASVEFGVGACSILPAGLRFGESLLPSEKVTRGSFLGVGAQGRVYRGTLRLGLLSIDVAIKRFLVSSEHRGDLCTVENLKHEIELVSSLRHRNVLRCYGCFFEEDRVSPGVAVANVVLEFCSGGDLETWLQSLEDQLDSRAKVDVLLQVARGMRHIQSHKIVHGDLSLDNVLLTEPGLEGVVKICDFGLSAHFGSLKSAELSGKPRYMPPNRHGDRTKIDVYSFGILAWEVWVGKRAFEALRESTGGGIEMVAAIRRSNLRPDMSLCLGMPARLKDLIQCCWSVNADDRQTFSDIVRSLEDVCLLDEEDDKISGEEENGQETHVAEETSEDPLVVREAIDVLLQRQHDPEVASLLSRLVEKRKEMT